MTQQNTTPSWTDTLRWGRETAIESLPYTSQQRRVSAAATLVLDVAFTKAAYLLLPDSPVLAGLLVFWFLAIPSALYLLSLLDAPSE